MALSRFQFTDPNEAKFLKGVVDSALRAYLEERSPPDEAERAMIQRDLAEIISQSYAEGERNPAVLKRLGLLTLWLRSAVRKV
jgi:hypothetical protein